MTRAIILPRAPSSRPAFSDSESRLSSRRPVDPQTTGGFHRARPRRSMTLCGRALTKRSLFHIAFFMNEKGNARRTQYFLDLALKTFMLQYRILPRVYISLLLRII